MVDHLLVHDLLLIGLLWLGSLRYKRWHATAPTGHNLRTAPHQLFGLLDLVMALAAAFDEA
jgi:hypothetical protein